LKKVAWFVSHPIQYYSPMYQEVASSKDVDLTVYYFSDFSVKGYHDKGFGVNVAWNTPLLEGHKYQFLKNLSLNKKHGSFFSYISLEIINIVRKNNYDLVVSHGWNTFSHLLLFLMCWMTKTPYALRGDSNAINLDQRKGWKHSIRYFFLKTVFKNASVIFNVGEQNKKFYQSFGISDDKLIMMPFAVDNDYFMNYKQIHNIDIIEEKRKLSISEDEKIILFSGKLIDIKQPKLLIKALANCKQNYKMIFLGDGEEREECELLAKQLNVNALFLGFINQAEIPKYYWLTDIFVLPSKLEPWGLSLNEAMCCECAVIVSDQVGAKDDLVEDNGFVFPYHDLDTLAKYLATLIGDKILLSRCKKESQGIIQKYSYQADVYALKTYFSKDQEKA